MKTIDSIKTPRLRKLLTELVDRRVRAFRQRDQGRDPDTLSRKELEAAEAEHQLVAA